MMVVLTTTLILFKYSLILKNDIQKTRKEKAIDTLTFNSSSSFRITFNGNVHVGMVPEGKIRKWSYGQESSNF